MKHVNHIIDKVSVESNTNSVETAYSIKNNISNFINDEVFPIIEGFFSAYDLENEIIRFDKLSIDCTLLKGESMADLKTKISNQIKAKLEIQKQKFELPFIIDKQAMNSGLLNEGEARIINQRKNDESTFFYFLENGFLPWYGTRLQINNFVKADNLQLANKNSAYSVQLFQLIKRKPKALTRLFYQFDGSVAIDVFLEKVPAFKNVWIEIVNALKNLTLKHKISFVQILLLSYSDSNEPNKFTKLFIKIVIELMKVHTETLKNNTVLTKQVFNLVEIAKRVYFSDNTLSNEIERIEKRIHKLLKSAHNSSLAVQVAELERFSKFEDDEYFMNNTVSQLSISEIGSEIIGVNDNSSLVAYNEKNGQRKEERKEERNDQEGNTLELNEIYSEHFIKKGEEKSIDSFSISNAGLILVHPFLKTFFSHLDITGNDGQIKQISNEKAVQCLHFMVVKSEIFNEEELVLEKVLCALPIDTPIPQKSLLTESDKEEIEVLLQELIKNWPVLKSAGSNWLREVFLQREGKLFINEKRIKIIVERKAQDILLDKINWNISMFKLPWIKNLIFVEW